MMQVYALNNGQQLSATFTTFTYFDVVTVVPDGGYSSNPFEQRVRPTPYT
jgi:hypothetical protein